MTLRWTIPFVSLGGTACHIDIYAPTASGVTTLLGASVPFEYDDVGDDNMLEFIRYRTGYVRLIERVDGELADILPNSPTDRFVAVYYGSDIVFTGYMQCTEFSDAFVASPREITFPVVSPMGLLNMYSFTSRQPSVTTVGAIMKEVLDTISPNVSGCGYIDVIYPSTSTSPWDNLIRTLAICPLNDDFLDEYFNQSQAEDDIYKPKTYLYFVHGLCAALGWMLHDTPGGPIFVKYEYIGAYSRTPISSLSGNPTRSSITQATTSFVSWFDNVDDNANISMRRPMKEIDYTMDGEIPYVVDVPTKYNFPSGTSYGNTGWWRYILNNLLPTITLDNGVEMDKWAVWQPDATSISWDIDWAFNGANGKLTFNPCCAIHSTFDAFLKITLQVGNDWQTLSSNGWESDISGIFSFKIGGLYYDMSRDQTVSPTKLSNGIVFDKSTGRINSNTTIPNAFNDSDGILIKCPGPTTQGFKEFSSPEVEVAINIPSGKVAVMSVSIIQKQVDYAYKRSIKIIGGNSGTETSSVTAELNNLRTNDGNNSFALPTGEYEASDPPQFAYMFAPRRVIVQRVKRGTGVGGQDLVNDYLPRFYYYGSGSGGRYRIIAQSFNPREDEYKMTLVSSSVLNV